MAITVRLRHPDREVVVDGPRTVLDLLRDLDVMPESVLVIRDGTILTRDEALGPDDAVELRPVVSGGGAP